MSRSLSAMAAAVDHFLPPEAVRGMKVLLRERFTRHVVVPALIMPPKKCSNCIQRFQSVLLKQTGVKRLLGVSEGGEEKKLLLLKPHCTSQETGGGDREKEDGREGEEEGVFSAEDFQWLSEHGVVRTSHQLQLSYSNWGVGAVLRAVLPSHVGEVPSAFETVGHIAHLNLREEHLEYKHLIGQVLLDKQPHIRTVVNKTGSISTQFRVFNMELLAGEDNTVATVKENGCSFTFDFAKVYWNSRLHTEHERLVHQLLSGQVVVDMFAGVGPFALPAAKKGCLVLANDLNPESHRCLLQNAHNNRVDIRAFNMDARGFVKVAFSLLVEESLCNDNALPLAKGSHVIMNLPGSGVEFLGSLRGVVAALPPPLRATVPLPQVHCYAFTKSDGPEEDVRLRVETGLGTPLPPATLTVTRVRDVAPNKLMMRATFELPHDVAYADTSTKDSSTVGTNEDTAGTNEDTVGTNEDTVGTNEDTGGTNEDTVGTNEDTVGTSEGTGGTNEDTVGTSEDTVGTNEDTVGTSEDTVGTNEDTADTSATDAIHFRKRSSAHLNPMLGAKKTDTGD